MRTCFETTIGFAVKLEQLTSGKFIVTYGKQKKSNLQYAEAAKELGECIMHACACDGLLDNGEERQDR